MVFNLGDRGKGYLDDLAVRAFYLHAWGGEGLSGLHAPDNAPHALSVNRHDLDIVFAVQRLKGRKCFCDFHVYLFSEVQTPLGHRLFEYSRDIAPEDGGCLSRVQYWPTPSKPGATLNATGKLHLAYRRLVSFFCLEAEANP